MIEINGVSHTFHTKTADVKALENINLSVADNEFLALVGRSGCGKSTLLRLIAGLIPPSEGEIQVMNEVVREPRQDVAFMFQKAALLPWRSVLDNVLLPIEMMKLKRADYMDRAHDLIKLVGLDGFERRSPQELSGGMQQRVSLVRAMIARPKVLLMDEPFSALDALTRAELSEELQRVQLEESATIVFVTHSIDEAVLLADRAVVLSPRPGRVHTIVPIDIPRPRTLGQNDNSERLGEVSATLHSLLMSKETA